LSPDKTVLLPVAEAGCPMADMATAEQLRKYKKEHPGVVAVAYVNSTAELKTEVDICCTSANAEKVVASIPKGKEIIFLPDKNLGANVARALNRKLMLWPGFCPTHMRISKEMINQRKKEFPDAVVMVHPECEPEIVEMADVALSTGGMLKFARETGAKQIIVGTELGIIHRLKIENPGKIFIPVSEQAICPNMKLIELHDVLNALENMEHEIILVPQIIEKARASIERMIEVS
jgi:quinolinate synthase